MASSQNLRAVGDRIEQLLEELRASAEPRMYALTEELVRFVTDLYGGALARVLEIADEVDPEVKLRLVDDELIASLLLVHGLHPESIRARVEAGLVKVRPLLAQHGGDVELLDIDLSTPAPSCWAPGQLRWLPLVCDHPSSGGGNGRGRSGPGDRQDRRTTAVK